MKTFCLVFYSKHNKTQRIIHFSNQCTLKFFTYKSNNDLSSVYTLCYINYPLILLAISNTIVQVMHKNFLPCIVIVWENWEQNIIHINSSFFPFLEMVQEFTGTTYVFFLIFQVIDRILNTNHTIHIVVRGSSWCSFLLLSCVYYKRFLIPLLLFSILRARFQHKRWNKIHHPW